MAAGNFSNGGLDTFDARKRYIGVRLQQGVPLLDRDWNELEDIRRHLEWVLRRDFVGDGVPDVDGFAIGAPGFDAPDEVVVNAGRCSVAGYDVWNEADALFSEQGDHVPLPAAPADVADVLTLFLEPRVERITAAEDPALANPQDINLETCVRDRLTWAVRAVRAPDPAPLESVVLAEVRRPAGTRQITAAMIIDQRRTRLRLADAVDRLDNDETRLAALEAALRQAQLDIDAIKHDLGRLFWDVRLETASDFVLFGGKASLTATVTDRLGTPIVGAALSFATDWGAVSPAFAATDANGRVRVELVAAASDSPLPSAHVGLLAQAVEKVQLATLRNPGAIQYQQLRFEPQEMTLLSRYAPASAVAELAYDLPSAPIVAQPTPRTTTVTVHAKEGSGAIVRGVGSVQVTVGLWLRDWARTKIVDVTKSVSVGARIGDIMRQGIVAERFDHELVVTQLPKTMQAIQDDTHLTVRQTLFTDPAADEGTLRGTGTLGQAIAEHATAAVGAQTNVAIGQQLDRFARAPDVPLTVTEAAVARTHLVQASSQIAAGFAQENKQTFSMGRMGG